MLLVGIEEERLPFCTLFLPITFLLANFLHFCPQFQNQRKILRCFDTHIQILWINSFLDHVSTFLKLYSPICKKWLKIVKNVFYKIVLEVPTFYTYIPVKACHFLKKLIIAVPYCLVVLLSRKLVLSRQNMGRAIAASPVVSYRSWPSCLCASGERVPTHVWSRAHPRVRVVRPDLSPHQVHLAVRHLPAPVLPRQETGMCPSLISYNFFYVTQAIRVPGFDSRRRQT